eukprot:3607013-Alexandrium_andersonii.AAC.1
MARPSCNTSRRSTVPRMWEIRAPAMGTKIASPAKPRFEISLNCGSMDLHKHGDMPSQVMSA